MDLLSVIFGKFLRELLPLMYVRILFPLNSFLTNGHHFTKSYVHLYWQGLGWNCYLPFFLLFVAELSPLIDAWISLSPSIYRPFYSMRRAAARL